MIINPSNINPKELNSYLHKVRVVLFNPQNELFITDMNGSYNLPGGTVEKEENPKVALIRELKEELGLSILKEDLIFVDTFHFYHPNFPEKDGTIVNRENEIDLFVLKTTQTYHPTLTTLTLYEQKNNFTIKFVSLNNIPMLIKETSSNNYKKITDIELSVLINKYQDYTKGK